MSSEIIAVVIPAGGGGTRLWPRSRQATPKQFLDIVSRRTMLQETADRVEDLVPAERLFVITNARHVGPVREQLPTCRRKTSSASRRAAIRPPPSA